VSTTGGDDLPAGAATWRDPVWRAEALSWAYDRLDERGIAPGDPFEQVHVRPWSTAIRVPTADGAVWLKAVGSGSAHEPALAAALGDWVPQRVLVPLAADPGRGLLLLPDGGQTLRSVGGARLPEAWTALLGAYARLQIDLVERARALLDLGVPDARPERLPGLVGALVADDEAQQVGREGGLATADRDRVATDLDRYAVLCRTLAEGPVPAGLQHDDLHDANVFVVGNGHRFFDWGDASVSHPFLSLLVPLRLATSALDLPQGHPVLLRLRDAYLFPWRDFADPADLRELVDVALEVAPLQRALTWQRVLSGVRGDERAEWLGSVPGWTAEHLEPGPLAGAPRA
jgi:Phosphotransferase enzyme family